jgi:hypothetical protein
MKSWMNSYLQDPRTAEATATVEQEEEEVTTIGKMTLPSQFVVLLLHGGDDLGGEYRT